MLSRFTGVGGALSERGRDIPAGQVCGAETNHQTGDPGEALPGFIALDYYFRYLHCPPPKSSHLCTSAQSSKHAKVLLTA